MGSFGSFVSTGDFSCDHGGPQLAFGKIVGGVNFVMIEEGKEVVDLFKEPLANGFFMGSSRWEPSSFKARLCRSAFIALNWPAVS